MPEGLLESELFGHVRGAFTDASRDHVGLFEHANGGTVFLDEVSDLSIRLQPKLLRVLQERMVRAVGSSKEKSIDVRVICATNQSLETAVVDKRFRSDLYFRINVVQIKLPPLRARGHDVLLLADHFLKAFARSEGKSIRGFSPTAAKKLLTYSWPGNVRELQNCVQHAVAMTQSAEIQPTDLSDMVSSHLPPLGSLGEHREGLVSLQEVERRYTAHVLATVDGNKSAAAKILGVDRKTLYRKLATES